jgi:PASTA domain
MRVTSGRAAAVALLLAGLAVLAVTGRLLPSAPGARHPATTAPAVRTAPGNTRGYVVPDVLGRTLAQAEEVMRAGGLRGDASERDPPGRGAVVVAQEPPAGEVVPPGSVVGFRTRTDVQPYGAARRLRLGRGPTSAAYRIVVPDPAAHQLLVAVAAPPAADVELWFEAGPGSRLPVLTSTRDARWCRPGNGTVRCAVRLGVPAQGVWTAHVAKRSPAPAAVEVTVTFAPA